MIAELRVLWLKNALKWVTSVELNATYEEVDCENEVNLEEHSKDVNAQAKVEEQDLN